MIECLICGRTLKNHHGLHKHVHAMHKIRAVEYYAQFPKQLQQRLRMHVEEQLIRPDLKIGKCWVWMGLRDPEAGYGRIRVAGLNTCAAHRISYHAYVRPLKDDEVLLHGCDNPACIRPAHLTPGTVDGNNKDRAWKGRSARVLSDEQVIEIKERLSWGWSLNKIHQELGHSIGCLANIRDGRSFAHVEYSEEIPF